MKQALIFGAVTPVGCRLAEAVNDRGLPVVAAIDDWGQAARLARLKLPMIDGRVTDDDAITRALHGCDTVFYCADGDRRSHDTLARDPPSDIRSAWHRMTAALDSSFFRVRRNSETARVVLSAALRGGISRVIWLNDAAGPMTPNGPTLRNYEERGLLVTVLRPATVYGPFCPWTIRAVRALRRGQRPRAGRERCLYVDHVVEAMLLAAGTRAGAGDVFPLHDDDPPSCEELVEAHARVCNGTWGRPTASTNTARNAGDDSDLQRARRVLGYCPESSFAQNMDLTAAWIKWSRL